VSCPLGVTARQGRHQRHNILLWRPRKLLCVRAFHKHRFPGCEQGAAHGAIWQTSASFGCQRTCSGGLEQEAQRASLLTLSASRKKRLTDHSCASLLAASFLV